MSNSKSTLPQPLQNFLDLNLYITQPITFIAIILNLIIAINLADKVPILNDFAFGMLYALAGLASTFCSFILLVYGCVYGTFLSVKYSSNDSHFFTCAGLVAASIVPLIVLVILYFTGA